MSNFLKKLKKEQVWGSPGASSFQPGLDLPYCNIRVEPTEKAKAAVHAAYDVYDFTLFESQGSGEAVRLDEFEVPR